jgi:putative tributyrin esterase
LRSVYGQNLEYTNDDVLLELAKKVSLETIKPQIYMTIGKQDFLYDSNQDFSRDMEKLSFEYTYEPWDGSHDWYFWDKSLKRALEKYYPISQ